VKNVNGAANVKAVYEFLRPIIRTDQISHLHLPNQAPQWWLAYSGHCVLVFNNKMQYERALDHFRINPPVLHGENLQVERYRLGKSRRLELPQAFVELKQRWDRLVAENKQRIKAEKEQKAPGGGAQTRAAVSQKRQKVCRDADSSRAEKPVQVEEDQEISEELAQPGRGVRGSALKCLQGNKHHEKNDSWNLGEGSESEWTESAEEEQANENENEHEEEEKDEIEAEDEYENEKKNESEESEESEDRAAQDWKYFVGKFGPEWKKMVQQLTTEAFDRLVHTNSIFENSPAIVNMKGQLDGLVNQNSSLFLKSLASAGPARGSKSRPRNVSK
jgi:hypothetical protein